MAVKNCPNCGAEIPADNRFCGSCGAKIDLPPAGGAAAKTMFFGATQPAGKAKLTVIKGEGMDGVTYLLNATEHVAGRRRGDHVPRRSVAIATARELHLSRRSFACDRRRLRQWCVHPDQGAGDPGAGRAVSHR